MLAQRGNFAGFGRARPGGIGLPQIIFAAAALVFLAGCASQPPPISAPLPYRFEDIRVIDGRPAEQVKADETSVYPFDQDILIRTLRANLPYAVFASEPARLLVRLTDMQIAHEVKQTGTKEFPREDDDYTLRLTAAMTGTNMRGEVVAESAHHCKAHMDGFPPADAWAKVTWDEKNQRRLSGKGRHQTMWEGLMQACVRELADRFEDSIMVPRKPVAKER